LSSILEDLAESGRVSHMGRYTIYDLDGFKLVETDRIEADDDEEAVRLAKELGSGDHLEIWEGSRKVRVVAPSKVAGHPA
jgi:hypothetical protein